MRSGSAEWFLARAPAHILRDRSLRSCITGLTTKDGVAGQGILKRSMATSGRSWPALTGRGRPRQAPASLGKPYKPGQAVASRGKPWGATAGYSLPWQPLAG